MKCYLKTFGCRVNQVESQAILEQFFRVGATLVATPEEADLCLLNTCTVTHQADKDAEKLIRQILRRNPQARLILTGCYAATHAPQIKEKFPQAQIVGKYDLGKTLFNTQDICWTVSGHEGKSRAFIKIQDGCDCFCSYCIVPFARPIKKSKPLEDVLKEVQTLRQNGFAEIVLTGINIGNYLCPITGADLAALCERLAREEGDFRVRFSSIELQTVTDKLVDLMAQYPARFCNYFHLPLQAGCDQVLKDMNRHYDTAAYRVRVEDLRAKVPQIGLFADVIAGYPTECEVDFEKTYSFIEEMQLCGLHVFSYSPRPGTPAAALAQLPAAEIKRRADALRALDQKLRAQFASSLVDTQQTVFIEEHKDGLTRGVSGNFQSVLLPSAPAGLKGLVSVRLTRADGAVCYGEVM